ncbi:hypothetical protein ACFQ2B_00115 [Streptomyces stramineus]
MDAGDALHGGEQRLGGLLGGVLLGRQDKGPGGFGEDGAPYCTTPRSRICSLGRTVVT